MTKDKTNKLMLLWYSHPRMAIAISLVAINLVVIFIFTAILSLISGNNFFSELAYIFTYTMSADGIYDFVNQQEDLACFIIKIFLTVIQMVIFSGALIGFTTDILQSTIDKRLNNLGKINLANHYVFLNWSSIGAHLVYDLSFLDGSKNIVILTEEDKDTVLNSIQNIFTENQKKMKNIRLFIKNGDPNSTKHLSDISLDKAKYIGILLSNIENDESHAMSANDISALKSLFSIMNIAKKANIVVEAENNDTVIKIEQLLDTINKDLNKRIIVFSHNSVLGHILGKTIINSSFSMLYHNLLSYDGCEFYGIAPMNIDDALYTYNDCIPIINYDDDEEMDNNGKLSVDQLYILSDNKQTLGKRENQQSFVKPLSYKNKIENENFTVFIFSQSGNSKFVIDELNQYNKLYNTKITCCSYSYNQNIEKIAEQIKNTTGKKKILFLSSDDASVKNQDEDIFLSALSFKLNGCIDDRTEIFAEITNPSNLNSLQNFGVMSVIVSNRIISLFMVQLLTHPGSKKFYRDLISTNEENSTDSIDLDIVTVSDVLEFNSSFITFSNKSELVQSFYFASNKTAMCIGIKHKSDKDIIFLCDEMDKFEEIKLYKEDELVLIKY
ncbi:MAG: hypothetical protein IKV61_03995 [Clostridia bacterium]|nr:hypothetical protein [Clostridia bacterium]